MHSGPLRFTRPDFLKGEQMSEWGLALVRGEVGDLYRPARGSVSRALHMPELTPEALRGWGLHRQSLSFSADAAGPPAGPNWPTTCPWGTSQPALLEPAGPG